MRKLILTCAILTVTAANGQGVYEDCLDSCQRRKDSADLDIHFFYQSGALGQSAAQMFLNKNLFEYSGCVNTCNDRHEAVLKAFKEAEEIIDSWEDGK